MTSKRKHDEAHLLSSRTESLEHATFESSSIKDRESRFVALFSSDIAPKILQSHGAYESASHRILAWRKPSKQQSLSTVLSSNAPLKILYNVGSDDDGEKYAGKKLEKLLVEMNVSGAVVVARWYGGILLGPVRFDHILNVAKEAISKWEQSVVKQLSSKKVRIDSSLSPTPSQETEQKKRLMTHLADRDNSIAILRSLLAEKRMTVAEQNDNVSQVKLSQEVQATGKKGPNYSVMPLATLSQLEKAKDGTIAWLLKQIDELEKSIVNRADVG